MIKAKYTVVLKTLMDDPKVRPLIDQALSKYPLYEKRSPEKFIPANIPTREELNKKILNYYKYREIGFETVGRFLDELETAMEEIMPPYNLLFLTADQDFNIIWNVDYEKTIDRSSSTTSNSETDTTDTGSAQTTSNSETNTTDTGTSSTASDSKTDTTDTGTGSTTSNSETTTNNTTTTNTADKTVKSGTPQGQITTPATSINAITHADEVNWSKGEGTNQETGTTTTTGSTETETSNTGSATTTGSTETETSNTGSAATTGSTETETTNTGSSTTTGTSTGTAQEKETTKGNFGVVSAQDLILKFRETIINIEQQIINDPRIQELFMQIY